jgi:GDSL-like Lipase/Acylhydrolase family
LLATALLVVCASTIQNLAIGVGAASAVTPGHTGVQVKIDAAATGGVSGHAGPANSFATGPTRPANSALWITCYTNGESISGPYGATTIWDLSDDGYYYSDAWVFTGSANPVVPACVTPVNSCPNRRRGDTNGDCVVRVAILGDSYISGEGSHPWPRLGSNKYMDGSDVAEGLPTFNKCHRSWDSWAGRVATDLLPGRPLDDVRNRATVLESDLLPAGSRPKADAVLFAACSGAKTPDFYQPNKARSDGGFFDEPAQVSDVNGTSGSGQLSVFQAGGPVDVVFVSVGGNDADFGGLIFDCLAGNCIDGDKPANRLQATKDAAFRVWQTLQLVKQVAPGAEVYMTAYSNPLLPVPGDCGSLGLTAGTQATLSAGASAVFGLAGVAAAGGGVYFGGGRISAPERTWLSGTFIPSLNAERRRAAQSAGIHYLDNQTMFDGHPICSSDPARPPYVNGITFGNDSKTVLDSASFHPTIDGYAVWANTARGVWGTSFGTQIQLVRVFHRTRSPCPV